MFFYENNILSREDRNLAKLSRRCRPNSPKVQ